MEAAVQRDPLNAHAWFQLGVKQQENEREGKAIQALRRALELDPTHLPSWLALAISHTNEGNRHGTYEAMPKNSTIPTRPNFRLCVLQLILSSQVSMQCRHVILPPTKFTGAPLTNT